MQYTITLTTEQDIGITKARIFDNSQRPHLAQMQTNSEYIQATMVSAAESYLRSIPEQEETFGLVIIPAITRAQGRLALHRAGLLEQVETVIAQADAESRIWYADAQEWQRNHPVVISMGAAVGLTAAQIDELFTVASGL